MNLENIMQSKISQTQKDKSYTISYEDSKIVKLPVLGFPGGSDGKESAYSIGDEGSITGSGRFPREENGNPVFLPGKFHGQRRLVGRSHGVTESWTWLNTHGNYTHNFQQEVGSQVSHWWPLTQTLWYPKELPAEGWSWSTLKPTDSPGRFL